MRNSLGLFECYFVGDILNNNFYADSKALFQSPGSITFLAPDNLGMKEKGITQTFYNNAANVPYVNALLNYHTLSTTVLSTDLDRNLLDSVKSTTLLDSNFTKFGRGIFAPLLVAQSPEWPNYNYVISGRPSADQVSFGGNNADIQCLNGVVQVVNQVISFPQDPLAVIKAAGYVEFGNAVTKAGVASQIKALQGATILPVTDQGMLNVQWSTLPATQLKQLVLSQVIPQAVFYGDVALKTSPISVTALSGLPVTLTPVNQAVYASGPGTTPGVYPYLEGRVVQYNLLSANAVIHGVDRPNYPSQSAFPLSPVPYVPTQWIANTIDPPEGEGVEQYNFLDPFQSSDWNPCGHWAQYPGCSRLESDTGGDLSYNIRWYLGCFNDCCYAPYEGDIKEWQLRPNKATSVPAQVIESFGKSINCTGWSDNYNIAAYTYWFTTEATTNKPILHRIDYTAVGVPPGDIQFQNFQEVAQDDSAAFAFGLVGANASASLFNEPTICDAFNILQCPTSSSSLENL
jgi:hypothetical protein